MSHENLTYNDVFNQANFIDSLNFIASQSQPKFAGSSLADTTVLNSLLTQDFTNNNPQGKTDQAIFNAYLAQFDPAINTSGGTPPKLPTNIKDFLQQWTTFAQSQGLVPKFSTLEKSQLGQALVSEFAKALGIQIDTTNLVWSNPGDWSALVNNPALQIHTEINFDDTQSPINQAFAHFLTTGASQLIGTTEFNASNTFFTQFDKFMTTTALLQNPSQAYVAPGLPSNFYDALPSYQGIFQAYGPPDPTGALFKARLAKFYTDTVASQQAFIPSQSFSDWVKTIINENDPRALNPLKGGSLDGNSSDKALILDRILMLLIKVITSLQNIGIAQANRLQFLTSFQNAYTSLQTQIPVFLRDGKINVNGVPTSTPLNQATGANSTAAAQARNDINSSFNGQIADSLRSFRAIQEDNAKKLQTNINSTNDAVNQQTDMISSFLQQLTTLISTILR